MRNILADLRDFEESQVNIEPIRERERGWDLFENIVNNVFQVQIYRLSCKVHNRHLHCVYDFDNHLIEVICVV